MFGSELSVCQSTQPMILLSRRLLIGLRQILFSQHRRGAVSFAAKASSFCASSESFVSDVFVPSTLGDCAFGQCSVFLSSISVSVVSVCVCVASAAVCVGSVGAVGWMLEPVSVSSPGAAAGSECVGTGRGGFSLISVSREAVWQSLAKSLPSRWHSSFTITSQSPRSSTSKLRCGSCSRLIRI